MERSRVSNSHANSLNQAKIELVRDVMPVLGMVARITCKSDEIAIVRTTCSLVYEALKDG